MKPFVKVDPVILVVLKSHGLRLAQPDLLELVRVEDQGLDDLIDMSSLAI